ncbi:MAG: hypothetical protein LC105_03105 [Chitinophagales bacterium]|nr:hypothetical protein [Chitinophagales bacterium]MCZ2392828.1 hypothetical protein [Chitinophagales bacterium]
MYQQISRWKLFSILLVGIILGLTSCKKDEPNIEDNSNEILAGGATTVFSSGADAYSFPLANFSPEGARIHSTADRLFSQQYISAPADKYGGLGPLFNQNSCLSCHVRDGRGTIPTTYGDNTTGLLMRLSIAGENLHGGPNPVPGFGGQLQTKAIFGVEPEAQLDYAEVQEIVKYLDGNSVLITKPIYTISNSYIPLPSGVMTSMRQAPPVFGLGLLEAISQSAILAREDIDDLDGDGISGKANWVWGVVENKKVLGRFGWKAGNPSTLQQSADAANNDMGLTSSFFPKESCDGQSNCVKGLQIEHDIQDSIVNLLSFYVQTLAVPAARNTSQSDYKSGKAIFLKLNCSGCHTPSYVTSNHVVKELSQQKIFPYTDLLLHDMGDGLADNRPDNLANGKEWRTAPLWGLGLTQIVNPKARFLHDGRAKTIEEAILWHGGEAENAVMKFKELTKKEREQLLYFLKSL